MVRPTPRRPRNEALRQSADSLADSVGRGLQWATRGLYRKGLLRTAAEITLDNKLSPSDGFSIKFEGTVLINGEFALRAPDLFRNVHIDRINLPEKACTTDGMIDYLRWEAVGNAPRAWRTFLPITGMLLGSAWSGGLLYELLSSVQEPAYAATLPFVFMFSLMVIPYHRILKLFTPRACRPGEIRLADTAQTRAYPFYVLESKEETEQLFRKGKDGRFYPEMPDALFLSQGAGPEAWRYAATFMLGGSIETSLRIHGEDLLKDYLYHEGNPWYSCFKVFTPAYILTGLYAIIGNNFLAARTLVLGEYGTANYHKGLLGPLSRVANDKEKLAALVRRFEAKEVSLPDNYAAAAYRMLGQHEKAIPYFMTAIEKAEARHGSRPSIKSKLLLQRAYFGLALTNRILGRFEEAHRYYRKVLDLGEADAKDACIFRAAQDEARKCWAVLDGKG